MIAGLTLEIITEAQSCKKFNLDKIPNCDIIQFIYLLNTKYFVPIKLLTKATVAPINQLIL